MYYPILLVTTIAYFITNYTEPATNRGYAGVRITAEFSSGSKNILPKHPTRPSDYSLALLYTHSSVEGFDRMRAAAERANAFPGQHTRIE